MINFARIRTAPIIGDNVFIGRIIENTSFAILILILSLVWNPALWKKLFVALYQNFVHKSPTTVEYRYVLNKC